MHAVGIDEDYVKRAIAEGVSVLGFSDHAPITFSDGYTSYFKMLPEELPAYVSSVLSLREKYADKIKIHLGLETEYYERFFEKSLDLWRTQPIEYIILGQHFVGDECEVVRDPSPSPSDSIERVKKYVDLVLSGVSSHRFTYIAHPDIINYTGGDIDAYLGQMERLIRAAKSLGMPLEYNLLGQRMQRCYPREEFWRLAASLGATAIIGCDAHEPWRVADKDELSVAYRFIDKIGISLADRATLVNPFP